MRLGNRNQLQTALKALFGEGVYTDDNEVCHPDADMTLAYLFPHAEGQLRCEYRDESKGHVILNVEGAGFEPHELPRKGDKIN